MFSILLCLHFKAVFILTMEHFLYVQRAFTAAVQLYDNGNYEASVVLFEEALTEYYKADAACRVLCEGPQSFRDHDHVLYRYTLSELISGKKHFPVPGLKISAYNSSNVLY